MFINPNNFLLLINIRHSLTNFLYLQWNLNLSTWMDFISTSNYAAIIFSLQVLTLTLVVAYHL